MPALRLGVGAYLDSSFAATFRSVEDAAKKARKVVESESKAAGKAASTAYRDAPAHAKADFGKLGDAAKSAGAAVESSAAAGGRALAREYEKGARQAQASVRRIMTSVGHDMARFSRAGVGVAGSMARGAGVNFDVGAISRTLVEQGSMAAKLSNQGFRPDLGHTKPLASGALIAGARATAMATGRESTEVLGAMGKFVDLTGDLETARATIGDIAKLANASGSELDDMASAAGNVKNALDQGFQGSAEEKMAAMNDVMRAMAGQGKVGAVEVKDLASQMSKLAAGASAFAGKREDVLALVGVFAQESRKQGGSASATQAATSVQALSRDLIKGKTPANFKALGIDVFADKSHRQLRSPETLIKEAISKSGGDLGKLAKLFPNSMSFRAVRGFANAYNGAGGGKAGEAAVTKEFDDLKRATMSRAEVERANAAVLETSKAKINQFNERLIEVGARVADRLAPNLDKIADSGMKVATMFGSLVTWAASNPWTAVGAALALSITKASLGEIVARSVAASLTKGGGGGAGVGGMGALGAGLVIASAAITIASVGMLAIDHLASEEDKGTNKSLDEDAAAMNAISRYNAEVRSGAPSQGAIDEAGKQAGALQSRIDRAKGPEISFSDVAMPGGPSLRDRGQQQQDKAHLAQLEATLSDLKRITAAGPQKTIQVSVVNFPPVPPTVDPNGRTPGGNLPPAGGNKALE